jgi:hypothetical protein
MKNRFSKRRMIRFLEARAEGILRRNGFYSGYGTAQLEAKTKRELQLVARAIEFGRMVEARAIRDMVEQDHEQIVNEPDLQ